MGSVGEAEAEIVLHRTPFLVDPSPKVVAEHLRRDERDAAAELRKRQIQEEAAVQVHQGAQQHAQRAQQRSAVDRGRIPRMQGYKPGTRTIIILYCISLGVHSFRMVAPVTTRILCSLH